MPCSFSRYKVRTSSQLRKRIRNSGTMLKIHAATATLATPKASSSCGMLQPNVCCSATPPTAASTMNTAFWMFMPAMTRDSSCFGVRLWIKANNGTT